MSLLDYEEQPSTEAKFNWKPWAILAGIVVIVISSILLVVFKAKKSIESQKYSAVFLDNSQVYFGYLKGLTLTNVYYLQLATVKDDKGKDIQAPQLIKLGSEIHGPTDEMVFTASHVLYTETLKDDSEVVKRIKGQ